MTKSRLKFSIAVATSIALVVLGVLFIASAAGLLFTGGARPYSRERVGDYLFPLIPSAIITVLLIILGALLYRTQRTQGDDGTRRSALERLGDYARRFEGLDLPEEEGRAVLRERKKRRGINVIFFAASALLFVLALVYVIFFASFTVEKLSHDVLLAFSVALPLFVCSVGVHIPRLYLLERSANTEYEALKICVKQGVKPVAGVSPKAVRGEAVLRNAARAVVLVAAAVFIVLGISNGGMESVLDKAVKICTECIGLG